MESSLEDPVVELQLCALGLGHLLVVLWINPDLATEFDKLLNDFFVLREDKGVTDVLWDPVLLRPGQIRVNLLVVVLQALSEFVLS